MEGCLQIRGALFRGKFCRNLGCFLGINHFLIPSSVVLEVGFTLQSMLVLKLNMPALWHSMHSSSQLLVSLSPSPFPSPSPGITVSQCVCVSLSFTDSHYRSLCYLSLTFFKQINAGFGGGSILLDLCRDAEGARVLRNVIYDGNMFEIENNVQVHTRDSSVIYPLLKLWIWSGEPEASAASMDDRTLLLASWWFQEPKSALSDQQGSWVAE